MSVWNKYFQILIFLLLSINVFAQEVCKDDSTDSWRLIWEYDSKIAKRDTVLFFDIYKGISDNTANKFLTTVDSSQREYRDKVIFPYTKYYYKVVARDLNNIESDPSNIATASIPLILNMDSLIFETDTTVFLSDPKYVVDLDYTVEQYKDSLTWLINDTTRYQSADQKLSISINPQTDIASFDVADDWTGPYTICFSVIDPDSFYYKKMVIIKYGAAPKFPPQTSDDLAQTTKNSPVTINVLANDSQDADPTTVQVVVNPAHGNITDISNTTGEITYSPNQDFVGSDSFEYTVNGFNGETSASTLVSISITALPAPETEDDMAQTSANTPIEIDVLENDSQDADPSTVQVVENPGHGSITDISTSTGKITYSPDQDYTGSDQFKYTVDGTNGETSLPTLVTITIEAAEIGETKAYPVPFRGSIHNEIKFTNIPSSGNIVIYNVMGEPVYYSPTIQSPTFNWLVQNNHGNEISAGLYIYHVNDSSGKKVSSGKLVIVR